MCLYCKRHSYKILYVSNGFSNEFQFIFFINLHTIHQWWQSKIMFLVCLCMSVCIQNKDWNISYNHFHKCSDPSLSTWLKPLYSLKSSWEWSLWHLSFGSFSNSSWQNHSSSIRQRRCTATLLGRCSIGFRSGLWLGHSRTLTVFPKPLLYFLGGILRVVVLLECKPSP